MRRRLTFGALTLLLSGPIAGVSRAETLAEAAAREAARRSPGAEKKAPAYTDSELGRPESGGTFNPMTGPVENARPPVSPRSSLELPIPPFVEAGEREGAVRRGRRSEHDWRSLATALQQEIRSLTEQVKERENNPGGMAERKLVCANGNPQCWHPQRASASPGQLLARSRARLKEAQQALTELEDEARRLSVPPGWLRER